jgi:TP901 family phage tail tape measure protein
MGTIARMNVVLGMDSRDFDRGVEDAASAGESLVTKLSKIGGAMTAGITLPILGVAAASVKLSNDLNKSMANVASLGVPVARVNELKGSVQDLSIETGQATGDIAEGLYQVISAFGDTADTAKILRTNVKLAKSGLATAAEAIALTSAVTKGYNDTSAEAVEHTADLAIQTVALGQTTLPELAGAIGMVTPLAGSLGVNMEDLFAVMATGSGVTGSSSQVATQFRGILQSLMAPTASMTALTKKMGYANAEAMLKGEGLQGTLEAIVNAAEASGQPLQSFIGSIEGQTLALALAGPQAETFTKNMEAMQDVAGKADEAFLAQTEGMNKAGFSMEQLQRYSEVLGQKLGDALAPALAIVLDKIQPLADGLIVLVDKFVALDSNTQGWILAGIGLVVALGPLLMILPGITAGVTALAGAVAVMTGPIGLLIAAVVLLGVAWAFNWGGIQEKTAAVWKAIEPTLTSLLAKVQEVAAVSWADFVSGMTALENSSQPEWLKVMQSAATAAGGGVGVKIIPTLENANGSNFTWADGFVSFSVNDATAKIRPALEPEPGSKWVWEDGYMSFDAKGNLTSISQAGFFGESTGLNWDATKGFWMTVNGSVVFDAATNAQEMQKFYDTFPLKIKAILDFGTDFLNPAANTKFQEKIGKIPVAAEWAAGTLEYMAGYIKGFFLNADKTVAIWNQWAEGALANLWGILVGFFSPPIDIFAKWGLGVLTDLWDKILDFFSGRVIPLQIAPAPAGTTMQNVPGVGRLPLPSGKAIGGPVSSGVPYIVGERGSELFVPNVNGRIIPNDELGGMWDMSSMGGGGVNIGQVAVYNEVDIKQLAYEVAGYMNRRR